MLKLTKLLFVALLLLSACQSKPPNDNIEPDLSRVFHPSTKKEVMAPIQLAAVYHNPINLIFMEDHEAKFLVYSSFRIEGLINKNIEQAINLEIDKLEKDLLAYRDIKNLPLYRGIHLQLNENAVLMDSSLFVYPIYSYNNVLSILGTIEVVFENEQNQFISITMQKPLNIDLTTGDQLTLSDLVTQDANAGDLLNEAVAHRLLLLNASHENSLDKTNPYLYYKQHFQQVAPFKGVRNDQPFYLSSYGIHLIYDYHDLEFVSNFAPIQIFVEYGDIVPYLALTERFLSSESIFENPIERKEFLSTYQPTRTIEVIITPVFNIKITDYITIDRNVPYVLISKLFNMRDHVFDFIVDNGYTYLTYFNTQSSAYIIGPYISLQTEFTNCETENCIWQKKSYVYDKDLNIVQYQDLFRANNATQIIKDIFTNYLQEDNAFDRLNYIDEIMENLTFSLIHMGIWFSSYHIEIGTNTKRYFEYLVSYEEIGYELLNIFD